MNKDFFRWFFTVHKCAGCGEILDAEHHYAPFCESCMLAWRASLTVGCEECFSPSVECRCMPRQLQKAGALCLRRLFFYESEGAHTPQMSLIYWLKRRKSRRMTAFAADNLLSLVRSELDDVGLSDVPQEFIVSHVPRGKRAVTEYGFDHSALVARALAERLGVEYRTLLCSGFGAKAQKTLTRKERLDNARKSIRVAKGADLAGKYVILFDDVVTSGASMAISVKVLMKAGARGVACFSLASKK